MNPAARPARSALEVADEARLDYFMDDYVTHLERHMAQVLGPRWAE